MGVAMPPRRKRHLGAVWARVGALSPHFPAESPCDAPESSLRSVDGGTYTASFRMTEVGEKNPSPVPVNGLVTLKRGHSATAIDRQPPTHNCQSAMILRFPKPDSHDVLQTAQSRRSGFSHIIKAINPTSTISQTPLWVSVCQTDTLDSACNHYSVR